MNSAERILASLGHREPDRLPLDFGGTFVSGMHVSCIAALRDWYGLEKRPVKVIDPGQMLGLIEEDLKVLLGVDTEGVFRRRTRFGFPNDNWKCWRTYDGLEVLIPGDFNVTIDSNGDTLMHPRGDPTAPPSARMPRGGHFFDNIIRQDPFDEDHLNPEDNLEEFGAIEQAELDHLEAEARRASGTGRAVIGNFGGTSFGDVNAVPAPALQHPKGIRDLTEWYISTHTRRPYIHKVFEGQCEIALKNLEKIAARVGGQVHVIMLCGTDFGTQTSSFCSLATFRELWAPYYRQLNEWIHRHTKWRVFKHSCGAVEKFIDAFLECGFDILNPVQCSATGMDAKSLKDKYGDRLVFWGGGVDTQQVLPFGTITEVREQVLRRCEIFAHGGGFVFNSIHNVQAGTPVANIVAMVDAVHEFAGMPV
ncbi:MAG: uroporphyrinogen decarboxylase family protein [Terriglobia bacterium]|jgi:hypothetical protein